MTLVIHPKRNAEIGPAYSFAGSKDLQYDPTMKTYRALLDWVIFRTSEPVAFNLDHSPFQCMVQL